MLVILCFFLFVHSTAGFVHIPTKSCHSCAISNKCYDGKTNFSRLFADPTQEPKPKTTIDLNQDQGGYTLKQRLREEVDNPFRKVRLVFFLSSVGSALTALYFSALNTIKAVVGGYADAQPLEEVLTSDAINVSAAIICGFLAYREYKAGQSNLERVQRGGKLASLQLEPAAAGSKRLQMKNYRRAYRVLIAAGDRDYISALARSMTSDQLKDTNIIPQKLIESDLIIVPVLLESLSSDNGNIVGDTRSFWNNEVQAVSEKDRNFDINRANDVVSFPMGPTAWADYLQSEIETAGTQGYDVMKKGITLTVKKNVRCSHYKFKLGRFVLFHRFNNSTLSLFTFSGENSSTSNRASCLWRLNRNDGNHGW